MAFSSYFDESHVSDCSLSAPVEIRKKESVVEHIDVVEKSPRSLDFEFDVETDILSKLWGCKYLDEVKVQVGDLISRRMCDIDKSLTEENNKTERWLNWAAHREHLKIVTTPVPAPILPKGYSGNLIDVRVFTKRGPDDGVFENNKDIREKVARGNCFLTLHSGGKKDVRCVIYALKKFTGGLGDDDDKEKGDNFTWKKFFTKSLEETEHVVCTRKANGEAAHLSCVEIDGEFFICGGSKNVHMLIRSHDDIHLYDAPRFRIAKEVCEAIMAFLDSLNPADKLRLLKFLALTRLTAIFEILNPDHQHVEDLSHSNSSKLVFITWTSVELEPDSDSQLCPLSPHVAIEVARGFGLQTVDYDLIPYSDVEQRMMQVRHGYHYEGEVFYFLDSDLNVIGLLKKKTAWYILCRALREKARGVTTSLVKSPDSFSLSDALLKVERRISDIQSWLDLDDVSVIEWKELGEAFIKTVVRKMQAGELGVVDIADKFPVTWRDFLKDSCLSDNIQFGDQRDTQS